MTDRVLTRGGVDRDTAMYTQAPYLLVLLSFLGMTGVGCVYAKGLALMSEAETAAVDAAAA